MTIRPVFGDSPIRIVRLPDGFLAEVQAIVKFFFPSPASYYVDMEVEKYRELVAIAQHELENRAVHQRLAHTYHEIFKGLLPGAERLGCQFAMLRAVRPRINVVQESIGWHRESFYGDGGEINVWVPILNVNVATALMCIPGSEKIRDEDLQTEDKIDPSCVRGSFGHYLGLLDTEKKIIGGVDLNRARPLVVLPGEAAIFDGALIHGSGSNFSDDIRFSIDFRVMDLPIQSQTTGDDNG